MTDDIRKLLTFGQMALEQGWYDQAREHFEQALALDASNREAMKGLARVNEILSRRQAAAVEPIQGEPVEPPPKPEIRPAGQKEGPTKQRAEGLLKGSLKIGCGITLGILIILTLCIVGLIALGVLLAPEPEEIEETVKEILATPTKALTPREKALPLGGLAAKEGVRVSINGYEFASSYEEEYRGQVTPEEGATFLWIHVYAENVGEVEKSLPAAYYLELLYKGDEISRHTPGSVKGHEVYKAESVYPGVSREGWILYELPIVAQAHDVLVRLEWHHRAWEEPEYSFWRLGP
jgi:hypothetical protein